ncbi:MAG: M3 family oligoendopeptidase [Cephaloticoccus sp.]|nr:M3 family oligoendopeptidase [Cephaloticoccus sp.]MCF7759167.1 M3 family oligoendopeptidase [Cephaloticoccus sp.]
MSNLADLPRTWDLASYFPTLNGPEYQQFKAELIRDLNAQLKIVSTRAELNGATANDWSRHVCAYEDLIGRISHLSSYLGNICSADAANETGKRETAELSTHHATLSKIRSEILRAIGHADKSIWESLLTTPELTGATFTLQRMRAEAKHRMSGTEEALAADLGVNGISAWGRLYDNLTGQMTFEMIWPDGRKETIPMAQRRALMSNTDRAVRAAAFQEGNRTWEAHGQTLAAALNAIAGTRLTLYGRRGQANFLDQPYFDSAVSAPTIDAMFQAIAANYEVPRQALRLGAKLQQTSALAFYDLEAPRPLDPVPPLSWSHAVTLVEQAFDAGYPALADYYRSMFAQGWIESEKRANKRSGAYCTGSVVTGEQRVFMTYADTMHDANTLAHEVGHAWHSHAIKGLRPYAQEYPMTLAETASTFAEKIFMHGMLQDPKLNDAQRAFLLDQECSSAGSYLLNIAMRYEFEMEFYHQRMKGELSVSELCDLMVQTQRKVYGDTIALGDEDPWFWASKLHFFITDVSFYNFPYTFGYLLSQALFADYKRSGSEFLPRYEAFLRATGVASCEDAVKSTLGWDLTSEAFWENAVRSVETPVNAFADIVARR